jgi:hypothetical protein
MTIGGNLGFLLVGPEAEIVPRLRELRALALLLCGARHPLTGALAAAVADPAVADAALAEISRLPAVPRRRLLASYARLTGPLPRSAVRTGPRANFVS